MATAGFDLFTVISGLAIITMLVALFKALDYKRTIPGGKVGRTWNLLSSLVAVFFVGYLSTPFFVLLSRETKDLIVSFIFLFGAVYVLITLRLVHRIIMAMKSN